MDDGIKDYSRVEIRAIVEKPNKAARSFWYFLLGTANSSTNISLAATYKKVPMQMLRNIPSMCVLSSSDKNIPIRTPSGEAET